jgi:GGDEF domain-containing protein
VHILREQARKSDVVAKTGETQLALLAPDTDAAGARLLVARLQREIDAASKNTHSGSFRLRAGYCAVSDLSAANVDVTELVHRANSALAHVPIDGLGDAIVSFDDLPLS